MGTKAFQFAAAFQKLLYLFFSFKPFFDGCFFPLVLWVSYLYKVVEDSQRNDDDCEVRSGEADDKQCPQHTQQTQNPRAEGHWNGFVHCEHVLKNQQSHQA